MSLPQVPGELREALQGEWRIYLEKLRAEGNSLAHKASQLGYETVEASFDSGTVVLEHRLTKVRREFRGLREVAVFLDGTELGAQASSSMPRAPNPLRGLSLEDRVKALNLGLAITADSPTGQVTVIGGSQTFTFEGLGQAGQALDLAGYVVLNTLLKMSVGDGPIASLLAKLPRHAGSCSNQNVLDPLGAYKGVEACGCTQRTRPTIAELEAILADESPHKVVVNQDGSVSAIADKQT